MPKIKSVFILLAFFATFLPLLAQSLDALSLADKIKNKVHTMQYYFFQVTDQEYFLVADNKGNMKVWRFTSDKKWQPIHNAKGFDGFPLAPKILDKVSIKNGVVNIGDINAKDMSNLAKSGVSGDAIKKAADAVKDQVNREADLQELLKYANMIKNNSFNITHYFWTLSIKEEGKTNFYSYLFANGDNKKSIYHFTSDKDWQPVYNADPQKGVNFPKAGKTLSFVQFDVNASTLTIGDKESNYTPPQ